MLVIRRRAGEALYVGGNIEIRVVEVSAQRVVLGILAPPEVPVLREEIRQAAERNQEAARGMTLPQAASLAARLRQIPVR